MVYFLLQKPLNDGLMAKVLNGLPMLSANHRHLVVLSVGTVHFRNQLKKISYSLSLAFSSFIDISWDILVTGCGCPQKGSISSWPLPRLQEGQMGGVRSSHKDFENPAVSPGHSWACRFPFP